MATGQAESDSGDSRAPDRRFSGFDLLCGLVVAALLAYSVLRAARVAITFDEAYTYLVYVHAPVSKILPIDPAQTIPPLEANNHVLNSLLTKAAAGLFGPSPVALRLPNLVAHALFLFCAFAILRRHASGLLRAMGMIVLAANPFLLEFFSLSRGYGLSVALLVASIDQFDRALSREPGSFRNLLFSALFAGLAVMANYTILDVFLPLAAAAAVWPFLAAPRGARPPGAIRSAAPGAVSFAAVFLAMAIPFGPSFEVLRKTAFWFGGNRGFVRDTLLSLAEGTLYGSPGGPVAPALLTSVVAAVLVVLSAATLAGKNAAPKEKGLLGILLLLLAGSAFLSWLQHSLFGSAYLQGRTALFLLPLFSLSIVIAAAGLPPGWRRRGELIVASLAVAAWWNVSRTANLRFTYTWRYDADTPGMLRDLDRMTKSSRGLAPVRLGVDWLFVPAVEYYRTVGKIGWLLPVDRESLWREGNDYVYFPAEEVAEAKRRGVRLLRGYPTSGNLLGEPARTPAIRTEAIPRSEGARPGEPEDTTPTR